MIDLDRLNSIETAWEEIESSYRIAPYTAPLNRNEEYQKLFDAYQVGQPYNPQFVYDTPPDFPVAEIRAFKARLTTDPNPIEEIYRTQAQNALLEIEAVQSRSPAAITGCSCLINGLPDQSLLATATKILAMLVDNLRKNKIRQSRPHHIWKT